jgi:hypothetical protein
MYLSLLFFFIFLESADDPKKDVKLVAFYPPPKKVDVSFKFGGGIAIYKITQIDININLCKISISFLILSVLGRNTSFHLQFLL